LKAAIKITFSICYSAKGSLKKWHAGPETTRIQDLKSVFAHDFLSFKLLN